MHTLKALHPSKIRPLLKKETSFFLYSSSALIVKFAALFSAIVILRWVPPESMGIWQTLLLAQSYGDILRLGIMRGLNRELPYYLGLGETEKAHEIASVALSYAIFSSLLGGIAFGAALFSPNLTTTEWQVGLICMAVFWVSGTYQSYLQVTFRNRDDFQKLAYRSLWEAVLQVLTIYLVIRGGFTGMVVRAALLSVLSALFLHTIRPLKVKPRWRWSGFKLLLSTGIPLYAIGYLYTLGIGFDRVILLRYGGVTAVGLYAPASAVISIMATISASITSYTMPRLVYGFGQTENLNVVRRKTIWAMLATLAISLPVSVVGWFAVPWGMANFFPEYLPSAQAVQLILVAMIFWSGRSATLSLYVLKAWRYLFIYMVLFAISKWVFPAYFASQLDPLTGVALGSIYAAVCMLLVGLWANYQATAQPAAAPELRGESK